MDSKYPNLGLNNGIPPSTLTDEEALALFQENGKNHPRTRTSVLEKVLSARLEKALSARKNQAPEQVEQTPNDYGNLGFYSGPMTSTLTGEEVLALWRKNGQNRPVTRKSLAEEIVEWQESQSLTQSEQDSPD